MKKNTVVIIVVALVILVAAGALIYASIKLNKDNKEASYTNRMYSLWSL